MKIESVVQNMELFKNESSAGLAFSAFTIAVSEPFLLLIAENWCPGGQNVLAANS
jgi:hypothetical protein